MILSVDAAVAFDKIEYLLSILKGQQTGNRKEPSQHDKMHLWETYSKHHAEWWKTKVFSLETGNPVRMHSYRSYLFGVRYPEGPIQCSKAS